MKHVAALAFVLVGCSAEPLVIKATPTARFPTPWDGQARPPAARAVARETAPTKPAPAQAKTATAPTRSSSSSWPDLSTRPIDAGDGSKDAAVIIGIEDYVFLADVRGARRNAEDWFRYLTKSRKVPTPKTHLLLDADATKEEILGAARSAAGEVQPGGTFWLVFIGHGAPKQDASDGLLVPVDAQQKVVSLESRGVPQGELLRAVSSSPGTAVVVLDACYSGKAASGELLVPGLQPSAVVRGATPSSAVVLAAARGDQFAGPLPGELRPAFSYLALGALRGWGDANADGKITAEEVVDYSKLTLRTLLSGSRNQTPELVGGSDATVLGSGSEKGPDLGDLLLNLKKHN